MKAKKIVLLIAAFALVAALAVVGTIAWLTDSTKTIQNTFTTSDITVTLAETEGEFTAANDSEEHVFKMVPGYSLAKDPIATVEGGSEKCYLFVMATKSDNFDDFMEYTMAEDWQAVEGEDDVFYQIVNAAEDDQDFQVLAGNDTYEDGFVTVLDTVTKEDMEAITEDTYPTITFTAYACQYMKNETEYFDAEDAWAIVKPVASTPEELTND